MYKRQDRGSGPSDLEAVSIHAGGKKTRGEGNIAVWYSGRSRVLVLFTSFGSLVSRPRVLDTSEEGLHRAVASRADPVRLAYAAASS